MKELTANDETIEEQEDLFGEILDYSQAMDLMQTRAPITLTPGQWQSGVAGSRHRRNPRPVLRLIVDKDGAESVRPAYDQTSRNKFLGSDKPVLSALNYSGVTRRGGNPNGYEPETTVPVDQESG